MTETCLYCCSKNVEKSDLPGNIFNNKIFFHYICNSCKLVFISPRPSDGDLELMYPPSYQQGVSTIKIDVKKKLPGLRVSYEVVFKEMQTIKQNKVLDFGCGSGQFVFNAKLNGFSISGVEFYAGQVNKLKDQIKDTEFYTVDEFYRSSNKYGGIYLSNVLEHFTNPREDFQKLLNKLDNNGLIIVEGPLEMNFSLVNFFKWNYFKFKLFLNKNYLTDYPPTHITYSNYVNQKLFFESFGLETVKYRSIENSWPYPETFSNIKSLADFVKFIIARISSFIAYIIPHFGNTFIYVGRKR